MVFRENWNYFSLKTALLFPLQGSTSQPKCDGAARTRAPPVPQRLGVPEGCPGDARRAPEVFPQVLPAPQPPRPGFTSPPCRVPSTAEPGGAGGHGAHGPGAPTAAAPLRAPLRPPRRAAPSFPGGAGIKAPCSSGDPSLPFPQLWGWGSPRASPQGAPVPRDTRGRHLLIAPQPLGDPPRTPLRAPQPTWSK